LSNNKTHYSISIYIQVFPMKEERRKKAESISKKIIQEYLIESIRELSIEYGIISISDVQISKDASYMDIYVSSIKNQDQLSKSLSIYAHELQRLL